MRMALSNSVGSMEVIGDAESCSWAANAFRDLCDFVQAERIRQESAYRKHQEYMKRQQERSALLDEHDATLKEFYAIKGKLALIEHRLKGK